MKVGRPLKIKDVNELNERIDTYFETTPIDEITVTGLCLFLGINKDTFYEYAKKEEYKEAIDYARLKVENSYEISLRKNGRTADIFALKNFGWKDKQEISAEIDNQYNYDKLTDEEINQLLGKLDNEQNK